MAWDADYEIITCESELNSVLRELSAAPPTDDMQPLILDLETTSSFQTPLMPYKKTKEALANDRFTAQIVGMAISYRDNQACYIPLIHTDGNNFKFNCIVDSVELELFRRLWPYLNGWQWCNHLERFDWGICKQRSVFVNYRFCTYIEAILVGKYFDLLQGDREYSDAGLKSLVLREFGYQMQQIEDIARYPDGLHIERVSAENVAAYACDDACWDRRLHQLLYPQIKHMTLWQVEMAVSHLTEIMEENGIPFRSDPAAVQLKRLESFRPIADEVIYSQVERQLGHRLIFDITNNNVIRELFFENAAKDPRKKLTPGDCLKLPVQKVSRKTKRASTDAKAMDNLAKDFEVVHNVLTHRKIEKADTSFLSTLPEYIHPLTQRIHSTFHQGGVLSGRYASSNPNAQNWSEEKEYVIKDSQQMSKAFVAAILGIQPSEVTYEFRDKQGNPVADNGDQIVLVCNIRDCIEVAEDELLIAADYRQAEFWGACELAHEDGMLSLIAEGHDPHVATASLMWGVPITIVPRSLRKKAKTRNYAMLFGETDASAAAKEGTTVEEQSELRQIHERAIPRVIQHRLSVIADGRKNGYTLTYMGRKIDLTQLYDHPDQRVREKADRLAYNGVIQGSFTGDMPKLAMARCMLAFRNDYPIYPGGYGTVHLPLIHNGHDSLMFRLTPKVRGDVSTIDLPGFVGKLRLAMEIHFPGFRLPAMIDIGVGRRAGSMLDIHKNGKEYAGQTAMDVMALINKRAVEKQDSKILPQDKGLVIKLQMINPPTADQAVALKSLLVQFPGSNVISLQYPNGAGLESVVIDKYPTSLGVRDAEKFGLILPCKALAESAEDHLGLMAEAMSNL